MNKNTEEIFKKIEDWVKKDDTQSLLINGIRLIKEKESSEIISIFQSDNKIAENKSISFIGYYLPKVGKFLNFSMNQAGNPPNNISVFDIKTKLSNTFSNIIQSRINEDLNATGEIYIPTRSDKITKERLAEYWIKGLDYICFWKSSDFPLSYIEFEDVIRMVLSDKDISKEIFDKKYKDSPKNKEVYRQKKRIELMRRYYAEKLNSYVPRETDVAFKQQQQAIKMFFDGKPAPKKLRATIKCSWNNLDNKEIFPKTKKPIFINIEIDMRKAYWQFDGLNKWAYKIIGFSRCKDSEKKIPILSSSIPFSAICNLRHNRKIIFKSSLIRY